METPKPLNTFIFANGDANDGPMVQRALSAVPDAWVIAADGGARQARHFGRTVHTLIGDMDSLSPEELTDLAQQNMDIHRYPVEKDETDLELALIHAAEKGAQHIRIFAAIGDRLDQTLGNVYLLSLPQIRDRDVRIVARNQEAWLFYPGQLVVQGAPGDTVSLIPISGAAQGVRTENMHYPLYDETLAFGPARGISNVMTGNQARVWLREGLLLVVYTIGHA